MSDHSMDFFQHHSTNNKHKGNFIELSHLNAHTNPPSSSSSSSSSSSLVPLQQQGDNEPVYFSRITQQWEPVWFYATMLKKLGSFAQAIDRCARGSRELVWSHIFFLYNQPNRKCSDLFSPIIDDWCQSQSIDLSALEIMYTSFLQIYNQYPGLFEDVLTPASEQPSTPSFSMFGDSKDFKKDMVDPAKVKLIKLNNTSLIWGSSFASSLQQFSLLLNWAPLLEKLPPNQKEAIWNTCQFFPLFSADAFDRTSFRKTFLKWAGNLPAHMSNITILFGAIGFLRDKGIIKHQFFFPNTTIPVFNRGAKSQPNSQQPSHHFDAASQPPSPHPAGRPSSPSPSPSSHDFMAQQPLHHFFSRPNTTPSSSASSSHPVLPTLDGTTPRTPSKSHPFDSLSLPPLTLPSHPLTPSANQGSSSGQSPAGTNNAAGTSSSRLGLLALAAFQADDTEAPQATNAAPKQESTASPQKSPTRTDIKPQSPDVEPMQLEASPKHESTETAVSQEIVTPIKSETVETPRSSPTDKKDAPAPTMKIVKRKNSSCADYHDEDGKRPRTMNLSHILCS